MTKHKITLKRFMDESPWTIAEEMGLHYMGDMNPFDHGGTFYNTANWEEYGYADCVVLEPYEGQTLVSCGTINKLDDMSSALECCSHDQQDPNNIHEQIYACQAYMGFETNEDFSGRYCESFPENNERDGMRQAWHWVLSLAD